MLKKSMLLVACSIIWMNGFCYPILSKTTSGWGIGYNKTNTYLADFNFVDVEGNSQWVRGWVVECSGSAFIHCPGRADLAAPSEDLDEVDVQITGDLLDYADASLDNGQTTGSDSRRVRVQGENFERVYMLTWNTDPDGTTTTVVDYTEVELY